jgi:hypothetical protein
VNSVPSSAVTTIVGTLNNGASCDMGAKSLLREGTCVRSGALGAYATRKT